MTSSADIEPRLVVTTHAKDGTSVFASDGPAGLFRPFGPDSSSFAVFDSRPAVPINNQVAVAEDKKQGLPRCPPGGVLFSITNIKPGDQAPMHRTESIDYAVVVSGEVVLALDNGEEKTLRAGDYLIQGGTNHSWANRATETCRILFVMVSADKVKLDDGTELSATVFGPRPPQETSQ
ncbi:hypothetical protein HMPREF1624_02027 [Sporothrix schenckii ATCC 58251]|uniref:Cupin type-2 domain-containing protein n=1 Tax=Sporothrix schenckii (strain ATCC 58251 / de Perez 2211183) TaxID=1391915 RepID=U7PYR6_SPOS1|nr:hypothetical protein HMPREF1624_02027 [Sporothrix schenckii ATCC 58251]